VKLTRSKRTIVVLVAMSQFLLWPLVAWSQVEEIVVTVRKKGENLQDVPMSITAFSSADIERKGIKNITDIARFTSSLQFDEAFAKSDTRIVVRGLSPTRGRQNAALLVDGIDVSSESITSSGGSLLLNTRLLDVERIEVVLGPQMALYGRSAFNGALQYITKDASEEFETDLRFDIAENRRYEAIAGVSGPIFGDALGFRLNGTWWDDEGFYKNTITNETIGGEKGYGLALTLNSGVGDNWSFKFRAEYTDDEAQPSPQVFLPFNTELITPDGAYVAGSTDGVGGIAECFDERNPLGDFNFIQALGTIPGNNQAYLDRAEHLLDPAFLAEYEDFARQFDPDASLDPNSPNFVAPAGGGPHCEFSTPARVGSMPSGGSLEESLNLAPNPVTPGVDYEGFDREMYRLSFVAAYEAEKWALKSLTGFTHDDNTEQQDINAFAFLSPDAGEFLDGGVNSFAFNNAKVTKQFSQDVFVTTSLDGPLNGMLGALYWREDVDNDAKSITQQASGSHCMWGHQSGVLNPIGIEDGCTGLTGTPYAPYQQAGAPFRPTSPADRDTEHWSIYGNLDFDLAESWTLSMEGRYNNEKVEVFGPIFYDPGASGGPGGLNPCGIFFRGCEPFDDWQADGNWFSDTFFPWTDEAEDVNGDPVALGEFIPDQALLASIPDTCLQQDPAGIGLSSVNGPFAIEREADGITPVWNDGAVVPILDADGKAQGVDADGNPVSFDSGQAVGTDTFNPWCVDSLSDRDSWFSPKVSLEWAASDDILFYLSWSRARKPGGFSLLTVGSSGLDRELSEFGAEKMEVWEFGGNTAWLDNTIILNGAFFFQDFTDKQALTSALNPITGRLISKIENAGSAEVWGVELSIDWSPVSEFIGGNWRTSLGGTWLPKREYTDFVIGSTSSVSAAHAGNCTPNEDVCDLSYTGNTLEDSAELAMNGFVQYLYPLTASVNTFVETDAIFQSRRYTGITNNLRTNAFLEFNFRAGFQGEQWEAMLYINNLLDDDTVRFSGGGPGLGCCFLLGSSIDVQPGPELDPTTPDPDDLLSEPRSAVMVDLPLYNTAFLPNPRVVGVRLSYRFGAG
jgi:outer membrane receptor protein involved in Fe transport